jgi:hypothetical protein
MNRCVNTKDGTMHLAPLDNAQQYCSVFNFQLVFRGLFLQFAAHCLRTRTDLVRHSIGNARCKGEEKPSTKLQRFAYS